MDSQHPKKSSIKMSDVSVQAFTNKKGENKYQLSLSQEYMALLLNGDPVVVEHIKASINSH